MKKFAFNGVDYGLGLMWSRLGAENIASERIRLSKEQDMSFGLSRRIDDKDGVSRYSIGLTNDKELLNVPSAAAVLSDLEPYLVLIEFLGNDTYWLCIIYDNEVTPGGDLVCSKAELCEKVYDFYSQVSDDKELVICVADEIKEKVGLKIDETVNLSFNGVLEEYNAGPLITHRIKKINGFNNLVLGAGGVIGIALVFCTFNYLSSSDDSEEADPWAQPQLAVSPVKDVIKVIKKAEPTESDLLLKAKKEESEWLKSKFNGVPGSVRVRQFVDFFSSYPSSIAGWDVKRVSLSENDASSIAVTLLKGSLGTALTLRDSLSGNIKSLDINDSGDTAIVKYAIGSVPKYNKLVDDEMDVSAFISSNAYKRDQWMHDLDSSGYKWTISKEEANKNQRREWWECK